MDWLLLIIVGVVMFLTGFGLGALALAIIAERSVWLSKRWKV